MVLVGEFRKCSILETFKHLCIWNIWRIQRYNMNGFMLDFFFLNHFSHSRSIEILLMMTVLYFSANSSSLPALTAQQLKKLRHLTIVSLAAKSKVSERSLQSLVETTNNIIIVGK